MLKYAQGCHVPFGENVLENSGMSCAIGCEFNVIYKVSLNRNTQKTRLYIDQLMKM